MRKSQCLGSLICNYIICMTVPLYVSKKLLVLNYFSKSIIGYYFMGLMNLNNFPTFSRQIKLKKKLFLHFKYKQS